jgi:hypothetical protein
MLSYQLERRYYLLQFQILMLYLEVTWHDEQDPDVPVVEGHTQEQEDQLDQI